MTFSTSSSGSRVLLAAVLLWSGAAAAQPVSGQAAAAEPVAEARRGLRVLVLPPENLAASSVPSKEVLASIERMAAMAGAEVIGGVQLEDYLARYRIRYTGGVDPVASAAARGDLGAEAILVTSVVLWGASPPRIGVTLRLVAAAEVPAVLWMDGYAGTGDDSIGLFSLGAITDFGVLQAKALNVLGKSLESHLSGERPGSPQCPGGGWFLPRVTYRARPDARELASVVVLPFVNQSRRRGAGEILALEVSRQFAATPGFRLVEPGSVREELLRRRVVMADGVSIDEARVLSTTLDADLVVAGYVFDYEDGPGVPGSNFTVMVIDRKTGRVIWESTSYNKGNDSETVFGLRTVSTAPALTCRMIRGFLDVLTGERRVPGR